MRTLVSVYLKGILMGAADAVPGISGGTIALITGIYDRLVRAIAGLRPQPLLNLLYIHKRSRRSQFVSAIQEMDIPFLIALGVGVVTGIVGVAELLTVALDQYTGQLYGLFTGLIIASAVIIGRSLDWTSRRLGLCIGSALVVALVSSVTTSLGTPALWLVFIAGMVAVSAMVLPGISGALLLVILGQYEYLLAELQALLDGMQMLISGGSWGTLFEPGLVVVIFISGAVVGVLTAARMISYALDRAQQATLATLVGLMIGGVYTPVVAVIDGVTTNGPGVTTVSIFLAVIVGGGLIVGFNRVTSDLRYTT